MGATVMRIMQTIFNHLMNTRDIKLVDIVDGSPQQFYEITGTDPFYIEDNKLPHSWLIELRNQINSELERRSQEGMK